MSTAAAVVSFTGRHPAIFGRREAHVQSSCYAAEREYAITALRYRTQERNRQDALERLVAPPASAVVTLARRRPTKPIASARRHRLEAKSRRTSIKKLRTTPSSGE
jgi:hypothetical protein